MIARALRIPVILSAAAIAAMAVASLATATVSGEAPKTVTADSVLASAIRPRPRVVPAPVAAPVVAAMASPVVVAPVVVAPVVVAPARPSAPAVPVPRAAVPAPPATAPTVAGEEALLSIPSLGIRLPILLGGQATIDRGLVTHYQASGWRPPVAAGAPGTYWLAAHHSTHGSPFAALPGIRVGALVIIDTMGGQEIRYQVTAAQVVGTSASNLTVYGADPTAARILLQTCEGGAYRLLVHGTRIS